MLESDVSIRQPITKKTLWLQKFKQVTGESDVQHLDERTSPESTKCVPIVDGLLEKRLSEQYKKVEKASASTYVNEAKKCNGYAEKTTR